MLRKRRAGCYDVVTGTGTYVGSVVRIEDIGAVDDRGWWVMYYQGSASEPYPTRRDAEAALWATHRSHV